MCGSRADTLVGQWPSWRWWGCTHALYQGRRLAAGLVCKCVMARQASHHSVTRGKSYARPMRCAQGTIRAARVPMREGTCPDSARASRANFRFGVCKNCLIHRNLCPTCTIHGHQMHICSLHTPSTSHFHKLHECCDLFHSLMLSQSYQPDLLLSRQHTRSVDEGDSLQNRRFAARGLPVEEAGPQARISL